MTGSVAPLPDDSGEQKIRLLLVDDIPEQHISVPLAGLFHDIPVQFRSEKIRHGSKGGLGCKR